MFMVESEHIAYQICQLRNMLVCRHHISLKGRGFYQNTKKKKTHTQREENKNHSLHHPGILYYVLIYIPPDLFPCNAL